MTDKTTRRALLSTVPAAATVGLAPAAFAASRPAIEGSAVRRSVREAGAAGDGATDDGPTMRRTLAAYALTGDKMWLPKGRYLAGGADGALLPIAAPVSIEGDGIALSVIQPAPEAAGSDGIRISPNPHYDHSGMRLAGFALHDPTNGRRHGRHGIVIDTRSAGQNLPNITLEDLAIGQGNGWAIVHDNDPARNPNGGLWRSTIARNQLKGGIRLNGSGDSLRIADNIISGAGVGIDVALVAGASCMAVERCNITSSGGAIRHRAGHRCTYTGLNIENLTPGARTQNGGAVVSIAGEGVPIVGGSLTDSLISAFGASDATHLVRIANTRGFTLDRLTLLTGLRRGIVALEIAESAHDTRVGALQLQAGSHDGFAMPIVDRGVGTMGVVKTAGLDSGWRAPTGLSPLRFLKSFDGMVRLWGSAAGAAADGSNRVTTLPPHFRPPETVVLPALALVDGRLATAQAILANDGTLTIEQVDGAERISIDASFAAAGLGHTVSPE